MPLRDDFQNVYLDGETISVRAGFSRIPGAQGNEPQNNRAISISTAFVYPATTQAAAIRWSRVLASVASAANYSISANTQRTPDGTDFQIATIEKTVSMQPSLIAKETKAWTTKQSIDVTCDINFRDTMTLSPSSSTFSGSLTVTASSTLTGDRRTWILTMPIANLDAGTAEFNISSSISKKITESCLVVGVSYNIPLNALNLPRAAWRIYHKV